MDFALKIKQLPSSPGVYIMRGKNGEIIYIGKAKNLKSRVSSYFNNTAKTPKTYALVSKIKDFEYIITLSESDALALECNLIKKHQPFFNILLKDGKQFAFIKIDFKEKFPKFCIVRKIKKDGAKYFGPYLNGANAGGVLEILKTAFPLRTCKTNFEKTKKARRPCLNFHLEKCIAPCINNCEQEYGRIAKEACAFLNGKTSVAFNLLSKKMQKFSEMEAFEEALAVRDKIKMLNRIKEKIYSIGTKITSADCFTYAKNELHCVVTMAVVREGKIVAIKNYSVKNLEENDFGSFLGQIYLSQGINTNNVILPFEPSGLEALSLALQNNFGVCVKFKKAFSATEKGILKQAQANAEEFLSKNSSGLQNNIAALEHLKNALSLKTLPSRIECYDISNTQGTNSVAGMVVFTGGEKDKSQYRKFKIKTVKGISDFASLAEVLNRRFTNLQKNEDASFSRMPNLIVIDGGKGQLSSVLEAVKNFKEAKEIDFCALAKRNEEIFLPGSSCPVLLPKDSAALKLLINLRDETHRFSITFHKNLREKNMLKHEKQTKKT